MTGVVPSSKESCVKVRSERSCPVYAICDAFPAPLVVLLCAEDSEEVVPLAATFTSCTIPSCSAMICGDLASCASFCSVSVLALRTSSSFSYSALLSVPSRTRSSSSALTDAFSVTDTEDTVHPAATESVFSIDTAIYPSSDSSINAPFSIMISATSDPSST